MTRIEAFKLAYQYCVDSADGDKFDLETVLHFADLIYNWANKSE